MYAIGIDIGTTSICGVVIDTETGSVAEALTEMSDSFISTENAWEKIQDVDKIVSTAMNILQKLLRYPAAVIGLTGQMHGIVYVNAEGKAVSPLYTWQDERGNLVYQNTTYADYLKSYAGYGNVTDFYNRENNKVPVDAVSYCTIMDYFGMVLCGLKKPYVHITNAAGLGCFDVEKKKFSYDTPVTVVDGFSLIGRYKGIPVSIAIGDNQASVFSTLANEEELLLNIGTGSQVSVISKQIVKGENIEARPYFDGKYLLVGAALCGGRAYGILKEFYASFLNTVMQVTGTKYVSAEDIDIYNVMNRLLLEKTEHDITVDTRFAGTRHQPKMRGSISGIHVNSFTPANITHGFLAGIIEELFMMYEEMHEKRTGLTGSGNAIRKNEALIRIAEERFGEQMKIPVHMEEAAYGAALFGLVAGGIFENAEQVQKLIQYRK